MTVFTIQWCCGSSLIISWLFTPGNPALGWVPSVLPSRAKGLWFCSPEGEGTSPGAFLGCFEAALRLLLADGSSYFFSCLIFMRCFLVLLTHCAGFFLSVGTPYSSVVLLNRAEMANPQNQTFLLSRDCRAVPREHWDPWTLLDGFMDNPGLMFVSLAGVNLDLWFLVRSWRCWPSLCGAVCAAVKCWQSWFCSWCEP